MIRENAAKSRPGMLMLFLLPSLLLLSIWWLVYAPRIRSLPQILGAVLATLYFSILLGGYFVVEPNQAAVLMLFGNYRGSERRPGLWWANPFMTKKKVTMRVRNFESSKL